MTPKGDAAELCTEAVTEVGTGCVFLGKRKTVPSIVTTLFDGETWSVMGVDSPPLVITLSTIPYFVRARCHVVKLKIITPCPQFRSWFELTLNVRALLMGFNKGITVPSIATTVPTARHGPSRADSLLP